MEQKEGNNLNINSLVSTMLLCHNKFNKNLETQAKKGGDTKWYGIDLKK